MKVGKMVWLLAIIILLVINITIYITVPSWQNGVPLSLLSFLYLFPIWMYYKENKLLSIKNKESKLHYEELLKQKEQSEEKATQLGQFIQEIPVPVFSINMKNTQCYFSESLKELLNLNSSILELSHLEEKVHPIDKQQFLKDKKAWLSGYPSISRLRLQGDSHHLLWVEIRTKISVNPSGKVDSISGIVIDITKQIEIEENLKQMAYYDSLTNLPNRIMLRSHLKKVISRAKRKEHDITIMFLDLDGFKNINDTLGHDTGDALLKEVANRLNCGVREEDLISRIGGDEFIIVIEETHKEEVKMIAERLLTNTSKPYLLNDQTVYVTPSIGISSYPDDGHDIETLIKNADKAMYLAKDRGKANFQFYTEELKTYQPEESLLERIWKFFQK
ncbi:GGDEF domain-containing protein [Metabacillus halosaccharovorans]|uniref:GGDEF domain-containing protein n=1 Tax=Metabacillus halosaccharovorans TaxID=930124 RepID=UPI00204053F7|nr:GGDEF domain-containing protein [Metabacillus halosaccharovorans]MCM3443535.1 GGDEF domain-containing protein [Metabacillus halosaccharovorans]